MGNGVVGIRFRPYVDLPTKVPSGLSDGTFVWRQSLVNFKILAVDKSVIILFHLHSVILAQRQDFFIISPYSQTPLLPERFRLIPTLLQPQWFLFSE